MTNGADYADLFNSGKGVKKKDNSLNSIYVVGANFYGVGLLNTVHVLLAYVANSSLPKIKFPKVLFPLPVSPYNKILCIFYKIILT